MQDFEEIGREIERRGKTEKIKALAESEDSRKLCSLIDRKALEQAAGSRDAGAMRAVLGQVLSTDEGQRLAKALQELMRE